MKTLIRAAKNKQRGCMRPAGRQFDMPALVYIENSLYKFFKTNVDFLHRVYQWRHRVSLVQVVHGLHPVMEQILQETEPGQSFK